MLSHLWTAAGCCKVPLNEPYLRQSTFLPAAVFSGCTDTWWTMWCKFGFPAFFPLVHLDACLPRSFSLPSCVWLTAELCFKWLFRVERCSRATTMFKASVWSRWLLLRCLWVKYANWFQNDDFKQPPSIMHQFIVSPSSSWGFFLLFSGALRAVINIFSAFLDSGLQGPLSPAEPTPKFCWYISFLLQRCHSY